MLPLTVALATSKEALTASLKPLLTLALSCWPVPAAMTDNSENAAVPLPAAVPMSIAVPPWSVPMPVLTESLFGLPGVGRELVHAVKVVDLPVVVGMVLVTGFFVVLANAVADVLYAVADRRVVLS